ncbi:PAAR domain-containing protein [Pseudomonas gingeri]|uniref:PAAR domain-containing protein n=1 Tax=Pseudomonas gingeri TaxID=117681 RepID=UPI0015A4CA44|nr:PAAR domain-containing protein [Pseudomonas gingeri]NWA05000.1 PAAR domain-containing protein [Pseudomonas gingeri]NWA17168.1 PAAR domain-containing protein [Pseudomonas gingeri]NWA59093.1 PAAR domain-containing protein [Pseudomonas gingeri]NWA99642.1 PAAR domain-containing protein [Pseudomonas gingeri]NWB06150.1 PAAR domain-containing protein [Pseudomonas gingeri]
MKPVIRQGDTLREFGGEVLEGHFSYYGQPIACQGDAVRCNLHGLTRIAEGSDLFEVNDRPVALHGHRCECGCTLVSSVADSWVAS